MVSKKRVLWIIGAALIAIALCVGALLGFGVLREQRLEQIQAAALAELDADAGSYDETSIVLSNTSKAEAEKLAEKLGAELRITESGDFAQLTLPGGVTIRDIYAADENRQYIEEMTADYSVSIAHGDHYDHGKKERHDRQSSRPKYRYTISDQDYGLQDHFDYINMEDVWNTATGSGITVAVIDTGIDTDHPEFSGRISEYSYNASEDKIVKDYLLEDGSYDWSLIEDEQGHGTTVAGVIASSMNSGSVVGVSPNVELLVIKAECDERGVYRRGSDLAFAIYYAIEQNAHVVNMSFAGEENYYKAALQLAYDSDVICVAAAGNEETASPYYPASNANAIGVGALKADSWELADYSNYGENTDIVAPGSTYTTLMGGQYGLVSGTSYSAPVVTGAIALLLQTDKYMTFDEVTELLYASAYDIGDLGPDSTFGYGALDVDALVQGERGTVTFDMLTEELENTEQVFIREHTLLDIPEPERLYAVFDGWYYDDTFTEEFNYYEDTFTSDLTLYAHWVNEDDGIPFTYVTLDDGTVEIRSYTGRRRYITIPDTIDGKVVSSIGESAFAGESQLREVDLPSGLTTIREKAFSGCYNLLRVEIPAKVDHIHQYAFSGCSRLASVTYDEKSTLRIIESYAFGYCSSLEQFTIPASVYSVDGMSFYGTTSMRRYIVQRGNDSYIAKDGVLYTKTMNKLLAYPAAAGSEFTLPENVRVIGAGALAYSRLTRIDLGEVTELGSCAFAYANLYEVAVPDSVVLLGEGVFSNTYLSCVTLGSGITELPEKAFAGCLFLSEIEIPQNVTKIGENAFEKGGIYAPSGLNVTFEEDSCLVAIEPSAFVESMLLRIDLPASLVQIGRNAFKDCQALHTVTFPADSDLKSISDRAFWQCGELTGLQLPEGLEFIGELAFYYNNSLTEITVPASVTELGAGAFASCQSLTAIEVAEGNTVYHDIDGVVYSPDNTKIYAYPSGNEDTSYTLPDTVVRVENYAFANSFYLKTVALPEGLQEIGEYGFHGCVSLASLKIPDSVTQISRYAFAQSWSLTTITLNETSQLPRIGYGAFAYCAVRQLTIPAKVSTIAQGAFEGCSLLTSVTFAENSTLESISAYMFNGCSNLQSVTFKSGSALKQVQAHGLEGMSKLTSIDFSNTQLTEIDNFSFRFCESLSSVILPEGTLNIGRYAFYGCEALVEMNVPSTVEHIGSYAFLAAGDTSLYFAAETLPLYLDENWDYGLKGYYLGVTDVITEGDFKYAVTTTGNIAILEYTGTAETLDLTAYDFGGEVTVIGGSAFEESTVTEVILPETVITVQAEAFAYSRLQAVKLPAAVKFIGRNAFAGTPIASVEIAEGSQLAVIEQYAFEKTENLASIALPASLTTMGTGVFSQSGLTEVTFAEGIALAEIPQKAFAETKLAAVALPDSVTLVNHSAFNNVQTLKGVSFGENDGIRLMSNAFYHTGLETLHIPANVTYIGEYCFVALPNLQEFTVDENNELYKAEDGLLLNKSGRKLIAAPAGRTGELTLPLSIEEIGFGAFEETALSAVHFHEDANILSLGYRAFFKAKNITEIHIPASVVSLDYYAFAYCEKLETVTFAEENQLKGIYEGAFCGDTALKNITIPDTIVEISDFAFYGCSSITQLPLIETTGVRGIHSYAFAYSGLNGELTLPAQLDDIGEYAFLGTKLQAVTVPDTNQKVLMIGKGAFEECNELEEITLPFIGASLDDGDITWFGYVFGAGSYEANEVFVPESLKTVTITGEITFAGPGAFYNLAHLETINLPHSVTTVAHRAFTGTTANYELTNEIHMQSVDSMGVGLAGDLVLVSAPKVLEEAFAGSVNLNSIVLPEGVVDLDGSFKGCTALESVTVPTTAKDLYDAFQNCSSLKEVELSEGVVVLTGAFKNCKSLEELTLPASVKEVTNATFDGCSSLKKITVAEGNEAYCSVDGILYNKDQTTLIKVPMKYNVVEDLILPETLTYISGKAFSGTAVKNVTIPGATSIGQYAFSDCIALESVTLGKVPSVDSYAFLRCSNLKKLDLGDTVSSIGVSAFGYCALEEVIIPDSVTKMESNAFRDNPTIESIVFGSGLETVESYFFGCTGVKSVVWGEGVTGVYGNDYQHFVNLETVTISSTVTDIQGYFINCTKLATIYNYSSIEMAPGDILPGYLPYNAKVIIDKDGNKIYRDGITEFTTVETEDGFRFLKIGDSYTLVEYFGDKDTVTLPTEINGSSYTIEMMTGAKNVIIPEGVTSINENAFKNSADLQSIVIPEGVTTIGNNAFYGCSSLKTVDLPESLVKIGIGSFERCSSLTDIELPAGIKTLENNAFAATGLIEITIPSNNTVYLGADLFNTCASLKKAVLPKQATYQWNQEQFWRGFSGCTALESVTLPENLNNVGAEMFKGCTSLKTITLPDSVTEIRSSAFSGCTALEEVVYSKNLTTINGSAFNNCKAFVSVTIPDSVTTIGSIAFNNCSNLKTVHLGAGVTSVDYSENYASFKNCNQIEEITVSADNIAYCAVDGVLYNKAMTEIYWVPRNIQGDVVIPEGITKIADGVFDNRTGITELTLPSTLTYFGNMNGCTGITELKLPEGVTYLGSLAGCTNLETVEIPDTVTQMGGFAGCGKLKSVYIPAGVTSLGSFAGCTSLESIVIPDSVTTVYYVDMFSDCTSLKTAVVGKGITTLTNGFFDGCSKLENVTLPDTLKEIEHIAFRRCVSLQSIKLPDGVTLIGNSVFSGDAQLKLEGLPSAVTSIGSSAFDSVQLTVETWPVGLASIGEEAFKETLLTHAELPASLIEVGANAFSGTSYLESITVDSENPNYCSIDGLLYNKTATELIHAPTAKRGTVTMPETITAIPENAFWGCRLSNIILPNGLLTIGRNAFSQCGELEAVVIPDNVTTIDEFAFAETGLSELTLGTGVTSIGENAFYNCIALDLVTNKSNLTLILGEDAHGKAAYYADTLIDKDGNKTTIDGHGTITFTETAEGLRFMEQDGVYTLVAYVGNEDTVALPETYKDAPYSIYKVDGIRHLILPETMTAIDDSAFAGSTTLETVVFPQQLKSIGNGSFAQCSKLKNVDLPDSLQEIGSSAFTYCRSFTALELPDSVLTLGAWAFNGCDYMTDIYLSSSLKEIGTLGIPAVSHDAVERRVHVKDLETCFKIPLATAFSFADDLYIGGELVTDVVVPAEVTALGTTFNNYHALESITLHDNVTSIAANALNGCTSLKEVKLSANLQTIGANAFANTSITKVVIPEGVTVLNDSLFYGSALEEIELHEGIIYIGKGVLANTPLLADQSQRSSDGLLIRDGCLLDVNEDVELFTVPEGGFSAVAYDAYENCHRLKMAVHSYATLSSSANVEILYVTGINSKTPVLSPGTYENVVITQDVSAADFRHCEELFTYYNVTGITIYVEANEKDFRWNDNFPGWHNGNRVIYGENWSWTKFYDTDGKLIYCEPRLNSAVIRTPAEAMPGTDEYTNEVVGWDIDGDGVANNIPATSTVDIEARPVTVQVPKQYTVTFADIDGRVIHSSKMAYGIAITLPEEPTRTGYDFTGWEGYTEGQTVSGSVVFIATWSHQGAGHVYAEPVWVEPACIERGYNRHECTVCGEFYGTDYVDALGHDDTVTTVEPGCETGGYDLHVCGRCGDERKKNPTDATGHAFGDWIIDDAPTCTEAGTQHRICGSCDHREDAEAEPTGHDYEVELTRAATCSENGSGLYTYTCTVCGDVDYESISQLNHDYQKRTTYAFYVQLMEALVPDLIYDISGDTGYYYACSRCGEVMTSNLFGSGIIIQEGCNHTPGEWVTGQEVGCLNDGVEVQCCTKCQQVVKARIYRFATGHTLTQHEAKAPTCTEIGWKAYEDCSACDYTTYEEIAENGHSLIYHAAKEPACGVIGWDAYEECTVCDHTTYQEKVALDHQLTSHEGKEATCTEGGWEPYETCSECDYTSYKAIDALGHDAVDQDAVEPKCEETGLTAGSYCDRCQEVFIAQTVIGALGHEWGEWIETKAPANGEDGNEHRECGRCDAFEDRALKDVITVESGNVRAGEELTVTLKLAEGHDVAEAVFAVEYDAALLVVKSVESSDLFASCNTADDAEKGVLQIEVTSSGSGEETALTVVFAAKADTTGSYAIRVSAERIVNRNGATVSFKPAESAAKVVEYKKGDLTVDGEVNLFDAVAMLRRLAAGDTLENESVTELDGNPGVTSLDIVYLLQSLIGMRTL